jgi:hypothetical protein
MPDEYFRQYQDNGRGHEVDAFGIDRKGTPWGTREHHDSRQKQSESSSSSVSNAAAGAGGSFLVGLVIFCVIWTAFIDFLEKNWVSVLIILGICVVCTIVCLIVKHFARRSILKRFIIVLASLGLIFGVSYFGMMRHDGNFQTFSWEQIFKPAALGKSKAKAMYAYINIDQLNLRSGPSVSYDIIRGLSKDARIEVIDNSETWWKIKYENIEGFVNSEYLRKD